MTSKRTPGPWIATPTGKRMRDDYSQPFAVASPFPDENLIAGVFGDGHGGIEAAEANARHIAALPDLEAALEKLVAAARAPVHLIDAASALEYAADEADAALRKARGE